MRRRDSSQHEGEQHGLYFHQQEGGGWHQIRGIVFGCETAALGGAEPDLGAEVAAARASSSTNAGQKDKLRHKHEYLFRVTKETVANFNMLISTSDVPKSGQM